MVFRPIKTSLPRGFHYPLLQFFVPFFTIPCSTFHNLFTIPFSSFHNSLFHLHNSFFRFSQLLFPLCYSLCSIFRNFLFHFSWFHVPFSQFLVPLFTIPCSTYQNSLLHFVAIPCCSLCIFLYPFVLAVPISCLLFKLWFSLRPPPPPPPPPLPTSCKASPHPPPFSPHLLFDSEMKIKTTWAALSPAHSLPVPGVRQRTRREDWMRQSLDASHTWLVPYPITWEVR